jgi:hypothetical protein
LTPNVRFFGRRRASGGASASKLKYISHRIYPPSVLLTATADRSMESITQYSPSRRCCFILSHHGDAFFIFSSASVTSVLRVCPFTSALLHRGIIADDLFCSHAEARAKVLFAHPARRISFCIRLDAPSASFHSVPAVFNPENLPPDFQNRGLFLGRFRRDFRGSSWPPGVSAAA